MTATRKSAALGVACRSCLVGLLLMALSTRGAVLWRDEAPRVTHNTGEGVDILGGAVKRDDTASDALYFKFRVDPLSDPASEPYFAVFQLFEGNEPRLAIGNAPEAWAYSAFYTSETGPSNAVTGEFNLRSATPEAAGLGVKRPYELPAHDQQRTIVFKVQYVPGGDDLITVWLNPDLNHGATAENQSGNLTTTFKANASFDQIRLRQNGVNNSEGGKGWNFSDMAVATSFGDFVIVRFWQRWWFMALAVVVFLGGVVVTVRVIEKRKYQLKLRQAEQERALERERARIARDLHDDLGSSLARISLLSSLAREDKEHPEQVLAHVTKISQSADDTVRALEEIVWAVRPGSDSLQSLVEYIAHFSNELFEGNGTRCRLDLPHDLPPLAMPPEVRHNIFLVVKEALTNVLKHAGAKEVRVQAKATAGNLEILVQDNGQGFDPALAKPGSTHNGLVNMRRRAEAMGGNLTVQSTGDGTTVRLVVNVARAAKADRA
jgi:signal transduction histidine kinase